MSVSDLALNDGDDNIIIYLYSPFLIFSNSPQSRPTLKSYIPSPGSVKAPSTVYLDDLTAMSRRVNGYIYNKRDCAPLSNREPSNTAKRRQVVHFFFIVKSKHCNGMRREGVHLYQHSSCSPTASSRRDSLLSRSNHGSPQTRVQGIAGSINGNQCSVIEEILNFDWPCSVHYKTTKILTHLSVTVTSYFTYDPALPAPWIFTCRLTSLPDFLNHPPFCRLDVRT